MNDLLLRALKCEPVPRPPIWLHRQAGRFLPEYRALRAGHSFRHLIGTPQLAAQITKLPIDLLGFDAAILFSDILVIAEAFGFTIDFKDGKGIELLAPAQETRRDVAEALSYVAETIQLLKKDLQVPLIGFCGGPYTVSTYMKRTTPEWLYKITEATIEYLNMQIKSGVDAIQIFDSWAGKLNPADFLKLALPYLKAIVSALQPSGIPITIFCRGATRYIQELVALRPTALAFDWEKEMNVLRKQVPAEIAVQGNLDPAVLKGPLSILQEKAITLFVSMKGARGFIFNLGHGIEPETPVENVRWLVDYVKRG
ncbi:MAG: uroporphyrinogen decarboxylase [Verrucomicrobia bacterium]|nr:uroporphyrinogen decarboxylase [Verrucomicrobiota bacterium]